MSDVNLLFGGIQIEKCSANVVIDLPTDIFCLRLPLAHSGFRLGYIALDPAAGKDRYVDPRLETENSVGLTEGCSLVAIVSIDRYDGIALALSGRERMLG